MRCLPGLSSRGNGGGWGEWRKKRKKEEKEETEKKYSEMKGCGHNMYHYTIEKCA
jgi:hypothetical protein